MTHLLIIEDRKDFMEVLNDWIEEKLPVGESWDISHCNYFKADDCMRKINDSDIILFCMSSNNKKHFDFFLTTYGLGLLDHKRVFLISDSNFSHIPENPKVEIHKCYEKDFVTHCIKNIIGRQAM